LTTTGRAAAPDGTTLTSCTIFYLSSIAFGHEMHSSLSHDAVIRVYDAAGSMIETHHHKGDFKEPKQPY